MSRARDHRDEGMKKLRLRDQLRDVQLKQEQQLRDLEQKHDERIVEVKQEAIRDFTANRIGDVTLGLNPQTSQQNVNYQYNTQGIDASRNDSGFVMMRRNSTIPPWDGKTTAGENLQQSKFRTFQVQMHTYFQQEGCYDALFSQHPIPVFHPSREELCQRFDHREVCLLYTSPSPRDKRQSRMPSSA